MMCRPIKLLLALSYFLASCSSETTSEFKLHPGGILYKLLAFEPGSHGKRSSGLLHLSLSFSTQNDSVFWDSYNNFNDLYVLPVNSGQEGSLSDCLSSFEPGDSLLLLYPAGRFFQDQYNSKQLPHFCEGDSLVKIHAKIRRFVSQQEIQDRKTQLRFREKDMILNYLQKAGRPALQPDSSGVFWIQKPEPFLLVGHRTGQILKIHYEGRFLNGRLFERSPPEFDFYYGTPDQLVKGLNYVMQFLNEGQTAKIILPSALAFGNGGSSNGSVPPYTPVLYQINCIHTKQK